jgi:16S rRNA (cytidine1402-2'-O)-methyltransferase
VLLIGPPPETETCELDADALLLAALQHDKPSKAAGDVAKITGLDRRTLYARAMELRGA